MKVQNLPNFDSCKKKPNIILENSNIKLKKSKISKIKIPKDKLNTNLHFDKKNNFNKHSIGNLNSKIEKNRNYKKNQIIENYEISKILSKSKIKKNNLKNKKYINISDKNSLPFSFVQKRQIKKSNTNQSNNINSVSKNIKTITEDDNLSGFEIEINKKKIIIDSIDNSFKEKTDSSLNFTKSFKTNKSNSIKTPLKY